MHNLSYIMTVENMHFIKQKAVTCSYLDFQLNKTMFAIKVDLSNSLLKY